MPKQTLDQKLSLFAITWPLFIEILLHMLMGNADTLMLSQYSDNSVAAVGVSNQIVSIVIVMFGFVAAGTAILVAQHVGAGQQQQASEISVVSLSVNLVLGLLLSIPMIFFSGHILQIMGIPAELMDSAQVYLRIVGGCSFVQAIFMTMGAIMRSHAFTRDSMYVTLGVNALNVFGNYVLIFGALGFPSLGVTGVAISTMVSRTIGVAIMLLILVRRVKHLPFSKLFAFPMHHVKSLLAIGIPSAADQLSYNGSQMVITYFIAQMGTQALTTKVYAMNIVMFIFLFGIAVGQGTQILIGHLVGAGKYKDAYHRCIRSLQMAMLIAALLSLVFMLFSRRLLGLFTTDPEIIELGRSLIFLSVILEPGRAFNLVVSNGLRAAGDVRFPVYTGVTVMWGIGVTTAYLFGVHLGLGLFGIWLSFILDEWGRGLAVLWRWRSRAWQYKALVGQQGSVTSQ